MSTRQRERWVVDFIFEENCRRAMGTWEDFAICKKKLGCERSSCFLHEAGLSALRKRMAGRDESCPGSRFLVAKGAYRVR